MKKTIKQNTPKTHGTNEGTGNPTPFPLPENCVLSIRGTHTELPVVFKAWINGKPMQPARGFGRKAARSHQGMMEPANFRATFNKRTNRLAQIAG